MARLAIEIRYSVYHLVQTQENFDKDQMDDESAIGLHKGEQAVKNYKNQKTFAVIFCAIGASISMTYAVYLTDVLYGFDDQPTYNIEEAANTLFCGKDAITNFFVKDSLPSSILFSIVTAGLALCYYLLSRNINKHYKGYLEKQMCRLRFLYAIFFICYGLRTIYQYFYGNYYKVVTSQIVRYYFLNSLPLIWDILSIVSILVMHHYTYSEKYHNDLASMPDLKSATEVSDLHYDHTNSTNSLIDGVWKPNSSVKDKKLFRSSITQEDDPLYEKQQRVASSKQSTFAFNHVDKFNTDNNTSVSQSELENSQIKRVLEYKVLDSDRPSTTSLDKPL